jgi:hypothetical protein
MTRRRVAHETPDRLYTVTGGRSTGDYGFDTVTLVTARRAPSPGMQSEHAKILAMCRLPTAVVEISAEIALPVSIVKVLLKDLLDAGCISVRHPSSATAPTARPSRATLELVLSALEAL